MPMFNVAVDTTKFVANSQQFARKQLPYIMAKTLTGVVKDGQTEVRSNVARAFKLRNSWTERGIRIKPADKRGNNGVIQADVHTDTANRSTGAPDYLVRQEEGGERLPIRGRAHIAVPTKYLRQMCPGIIPPELRPKALLGAVGGRYTGRNRKGQIALRNQVRVQGFEFFLHPNPENPTSIMGRYFTDRAAYPFYLLIREAHIQKSQLNMVATVKRIAEERFEPRWDENWRAAFAAGIKL